MRRCRLSSLPLWPTRASLRLLWNRKLASRLSMTPGAVFPYLYAFTLIQLLTKVCLVISLLNQSNYERILAHVEIF